MATDYQVYLNFYDGTNSYDFPQVQSETGSDLIDDKAVIIEGNRGDGCLYIPGGKRPLRITVTGILMGDDYKDLTTQMNTMKSKVTTNLATLSLKHYDSGWVTDWTYSVRRVSEINFEETLRIDSQKYNIEFIVLAY